MVPCHYRTGGVGLTWDVRVGTEALIFWVTLGLSLLLGEMGAVMPQSKAEEEQVHECTHCLVPTVLILRRLFPSTPSLHQGSPGQPGAAPARQ